VKPAGMGEGVKRESLEDKMNDLATNNKNKYNRDIYKGTNEIQAKTIA
jgi:hypothetical protein